MTLLAQLRRRLDSWLLGREHAIVLDHHRRHRERIDREHLYIAARLEAVQADLSFKARAYTRASRRPSEVIPFPWRLSR